MDHALSFAELTDDDVPAVTELCRTALDLPEDAAEAAQIVARLRECEPLPAMPEFQPHGHGPRSASLAGGQTGLATPRRTTGIVARCDGAVVGAALASISHRDPAIGHVDLFAVHSQWRHQGIGRSLLTEAEQALAALGATEVVLMGNAPHYAWPGIDVRYTPAICLATSLGYEQHRTAWNMTADLSDASPAMRDNGPAEQRLATQGITLRRATADDLTSLVEFAQLNFGGSWGAEVADSIGRDQAGCHVAVRGTELLGFAAYGSSRPSMFGPMGTAPAAEGLGIGGVLLRRCLRDQRAAGHESAQIGWVGPVKFYSNAAGARIERVFFLYRKQL